MRKRVLIFGDTSAFHQLSALNFTAFCELVAATYEIRRTYSFRYFPVEALRYEEFVRLVESDPELQAHLDAVEVVIVHGEGLLEREAGYSWPYLYVARYVKARSDAQVWLVNFCMYEPEPFAAFLELFDYVACRDEITAERLRRLRVEPSLSFDCSVLAVEEIPAFQDEGWAAAIRGRYAFDATTAMEVRKLDCCWSWDDAGAYQFASSAEVLPFLARASVCYTSSFHGCIAAFLAGVPFTVVDCDAANVKYRSVESDILLGLGPRAGRVALREFYRTRLAELQRRARWNVR